MENPDPELPKHRQYYFYERESFNCQNCNWSGTGAQTVGGLEPFERLCPGCNSTLAYILSPTDEEVLAHGTDTEKAALRVMRRFQRDYQASLLNDSSQLPDLPDTEMEFILHEENELACGGCIFITYKGEVIWSELRGYEYYKRFIELAKLLKQKYGTRMIDLIPDDGGSIDLYGDAIAAPALVDECRKALCEEGPRLEGL